MRSREFVIERGQLNEVAPLAFLAPVLPASLAWIGTAGLGAVAGWAASAYFSYSTGKDILNAYNEHGPDLEQWPQELKDELLGGMVATVLFAVAPAVKPAFMKAWKGISSKFKKEAFDSAAPKLKQEIEKNLKTVNKPAAGGGGSATGTKNPNNIERPFSKDAPPVKDPNRVERPYSKDATPAPKNPNLIDRPYQKEELVRLAGLAK